MPLAEAAGHLGAETLVAGRVLRRREAPPAILLADESGVAWIEGACGAIRPGDIAAVEVRPGGRRTLTVARAVVLTPYRGGAPFPSPGGAYHHLNVGDPPRAARLRQRARLLAALRAFLDARGYVEVQTPRLVRHPGMEPHLRPLRAEGGYLITSPEYQMKRLLAGGLERIYSLGPCFRGDEAGRHHLPEFEMLEWYRAYGSAEGLMEETEALVRAAAVAVAPEGGERLGGVDLAPPFARVSVTEAFRRHAGVDLAGAPDAAALAARARAAGIAGADPGGGYAAVFSRILVERVEPALARLRRPVFLHGFPAPLAALARLDPRDPAVAERWELYAGGLELANAFGELTDPVEQRRRLEAERAERRAAGRDAPALDERFLAALEEGMPPACGIALGVDRLLMLLVGERDIRMTVAFPPDTL